MKNNFFLLSIFTVSYFIATASDAFALSGSGTGGPFTINTLTSFRAPENVHATSRAGGDMCQTGVEITWDFVPGATNYAVYFSRTKNVATTSTSGRVRLSIIQGNIDFDDAAYRGERSREGWYSVCVCDKDGKPLSPFSEPVWGDWSADAFEPPQLEKIELNTPSVSKPAVISGRENRIYLKLSAYDHLAYPDIRVRLTAFSTGNPRQTATIVSDDVPVDATQRADGTFVVVPMYFPPGAHGNYNLRVEILGTRSGALGFLGFGNREVLSTTNIKMRVFFLRDENDGINFKGSGKNAWNWVRYWRPEADGAIKCGRGLKALKPGGMFCDDLIAMQVIKARSATTLTHKKTGQTISIRASSEGLDSASRAVFREEIRHYEAFPRVKQRNGVWYSTITGRRVENKDRDTLSKDDEALYSGVIVNHLDLRDDLDGTYDFYAKFNGSLEFSWRESSFERYHGGFGGYADQETYVFHEESSENNLMNPYMDWAYPGSRSNMGSFINDFYALPSPRTTLSSSVATQATFETSQKSSPRSTGESASVDLASGCEAFPEEYAEEPFETTWAGIQAVRILEPDRNDDGSISAIRIGVTVSVDEELAARCSVYLADGQGSAICKASTVAVMDSGTTEVVVSFPAGLLLESGASSFQVAYSEVSHALAPYPIVCATAKPALDIGSSQSLGLAEPDVRILGVKGLRQTDGKLVLGVSIHSALSDTFDLFGALYAENSGVFLSMGSLGNVPLLPGENRIELPFDATALSEAKDSFPWLLDSLELRRAGERVTRWNGTFRIAEDDIDLGTLLKSGSILDKNAAAVSWLAPLISGSTTNALRLSITAPFRCAETTRCRFWTQLSGADGVAATAETVADCTNGMNQVVLYFHASDLVASGVSAPYSVDAIWIDPLSESSRAVAIPFDDPWNQAVVAAAEDSATFAFGESGATVSKGTDALQVSIPIVARRAGSAVVRASLYSSDGSFVSGAEAGLNVTVDGNAVVVLRFPYLDIRHVEAPGPYFLEGIVLVPDDEGAQPIEFAACPVPVAPFAPLSPVTGLRAEFSAATGACLLRWWADGDAEGYRIYRSDSDDFSSAVLLGTTDGISFRDDSPPAGRMLRYWVAPLWHGAEGPVGEPVEIETAARNTSIIILDAQGGTGGTDFVTATRGGTLPGITVPVKQGYDFGGYFFDMNGSGAQYYSATGAGLRPWDRVGRTTLFAKWTAPAPAGGGQPVADGQRTETVNGITWTFLVKDGFASVGGGSNAWSNSGGSSYSCPRAVPATTTGAIAIPETLGGLPVKSIGWYAFEGCASITSIEIPCGVERIGPCAFSRCASLSAVSLPSGLVEFDDYAFSHCVSLRSITIPSSVRSRGIHAFVGCDSLTEIVAESSPYRISLDGVLYGYFDTLGISKHLTIEVFPAGKEVSTYAIQEGTIEIADCAFYSCRKLTSISIPQGVVRIGMSAFSDCTGITSLAIPNSVSEIGYFAFSGMSGIRDLTIPLNVKSIGKYAFSGCSSLRALALPRRFEGATGEFSIPSGCAVTYYGAMSLSIDGSACVSGGDAISLTCTATTDLGTTVTVSPDWTIVSGASFGTISDKGVFKANATDTVRTVTVKATLDDVSTTRQIIILPSSVPLATALDNTALTFTTGGDAPWTGQTAVTHDGEDAARSGTIDHNQTSWLQSTVAGPGEISFWWCASSQGVPYDYLEFLVDGVQYGKIGGTAATWSSKSIPIGVGTHTLRWSYRKNASISSGSDCGWIDQVVWRPIRTITFDRQGGSGGSLSAIVTNGAALPAISIPVRPGYTFGGYWTGTNGTGTQYYSESGSGLRTWNSSYNTTLYAKWTENDHTQTVDGIVWTYTVANGEAWVGDGIRPSAQGTTAIPKDTTGAIAIPETLGGFPVTGINDYAFYGCASLTAIAIHDGVKHIGREAFCGCKSLLDLTLPDGNTSLLFWAMDGCTSLTNVILPNGIRFLTGTFRNCVNLESVLLPDTLQGIYQQAFQGCQGFTSFEIPDGVVELGNWLFQNSTNLVEVRIPASVSYISEYGALGRCPALERIIVDGASPWFRSVGGVLYDADMSALLQMPGGVSGSFSIPASVTVIGPFAFHNCSKITSLHLPDGLVSIGRDAFSSCSMIETLFIPATVTNIGESAFLWCDDLEKLYLPRRFEGATTSMDIPSRCEVVFYDPGLESAVVTLDSQEGVGGSSSVVPTLGHSLPAILVPSRLGYSFAGYWTEPNGNGVQYYGADGKPLRICDFSSAMTLYAQWTENHPEVTLSFDKAGGSGGLESVCATYGRALPRVTVPSKSGYAFNGYWTGVNGSGSQYYNASGIGVCLCGAGTDATLHAKWIRSFVSVTFDRQNGTGGTASVTATYGIEMPVITVPTRTGYIFEGYYSSVNGGGTQYYTAAGTSARTWNKTAATTLYANWTAMPYTVKFDRNGGKGTMANQVIACNAMAKLSANKFTKSGCTFIGWAKAKAGKVAYANGALVKNLAAAGGSVTLYAQWAVAKYAVAYNANGGKLPKGKKMAAQTVAYGKAAALRKNVFTKKGCVFAGWATSKANAKKGIVAFANGQKVSNLRTDGKTTTLYAVWAKKTYKVAFHANGGTGKMAVQTFKYGKAAKLKANQFRAPKGKKFGGWATSPFNAWVGKVAYKNKKAVKNLVKTGKTVKLYAVWKRK